MKEAIRGTWEAMLSPTLVHMQTKDRQAHLVFEMSGQKRQLRDRELKRKKCPH